MTQPLIDTIVTTTFIRKDIDRRLGMLREYLEGKFFTGKTADVTFIAYLATQKISEEDREILPVWEHIITNTVTKDNFYDFFDSVNQRFKELPTVKLFIPFIPTSTDAHEFGIWFRKQVDPRIILELHEEPSLVAGCAFVWQGVYREYSLRYFLRQKIDVINTIFTSYAG